MYSVDHGVKLNHLLFAWLQEQTCDPIVTYRRFERAVASVRMTLFLQHDIPGVRYWQPPGQDLPFATAPGQSHGRSDVARINRLEFVARFGEYEDL